MLAYSINTPMHIVVGQGEVERIPAILFQEKPEKGKILLLTDAGVSKTGIPQKTASQMTNQGFCVELLDTVPAEPYSEDIDGLAAQSRGKGIEFIVAIGGGSVMDTAKILSVLIPRTNLTAESLLEQGVSARGLPTLMVPTTAGTGSEATPVAIMAIRKKKLKIGVVSNFLISQRVVLDPLTTVGLPPSITASTGVDALCHLVECYTSKKANPYSDMIAVEGMRLVFSSLGRAFENGSDLEARSHMLLASFYGGLCIATSSTTAVHALSYPLGGAYRIPHGVANSMLLAPVMEFNRDVVADKFIAAAERIGIQKAPGEPDLSYSFVRTISELVRKVQIPMQLRELGISKKDIPDLTDRALQVTRLLSNNPKPMSREDVAAIYEKIL